MKTQLKRVEKEEDSEEDDDKKKSLLPEDKEFLSYLLKMGDIQ